MAQMKPQEALVQQAVAAFRKRDYQKAKEFYQEAAERYGNQWFRMNIELCEARIQGKRSTTGLPRNARQLPAAAPAAPPPPGDTSALARQLDETQALLEKYYTRCQELEYRKLEPQQ